MKTSKLIGPALDWAVANCEDMQFKPVNGLGSIWFRLGLWTRPNPSGQTQPFVMCHEYAEWAKKCGTPVLRQGTLIWGPSTDWAQGGPIIDQHHIAVRPNMNGNKSWLAEIKHANTTYQALGPTALVAAMRCYVFSKLDDEVELPEELK